MNFKDKKARTSKIDFAFENRTVISQFLSSLSYWKLYILSKV